MVHLSAWGHTRDASLSVKAVRPFRVPRVLRVFLGSRVYRLRAVCTLNPKPGLEFGALRFRGNDPGLKDPRLERCIRSIRIINMCKLVCYVFWWFIQLPIVYLFRSVLAFLCRKNLGCLTMKHSWAVGASGSDLRLP